MLKANLFPLEMCDFDVILGMHWLSTQQEHVDCFTKKFQGDRRVHGLGFGSEEITAQRV